MFSNEENGVGLEAFEIQLALRHAGETVAHCCLDSLTQSSKKVGMQELSEAM